MNFFVLTLALAIIAGSQGSVLHDTPAPPSDTQEFSQAAIHDYEAVDKKLDIIAKSETGEATRSPISDPASLKMSSDPDSLEMSSPNAASLSVGQSITVRGTIPGEPGSFAINLAGAEGDIPFQFYPMFSGPEVSSIECSTYLNGAWTPPQTAKNVPFKQGDNVEIAIEVATKYYEVSANGNTLLNYVHRDFSTIRTVFVTGYLESPKIRINGLKFGNSQSQVKFSIVGNVPLNAESFDVKFIQIQHPHNILFHIAIQIKDGKVVRDQTIDGTVISEEVKIALMPFSPGRAFHMEILALGNKYTVVVNGLLLFDYTTKFPLNQVDQLEISGDVTLSSVSIPSPSGQ